MECFVELSLGGTAHGVGEQGKRGFHSVGIGDAQSFYIEGFTHDAAARTISATAAAGTATREATVDVGERLFCRLVVRVLVHVAFRKVLQEAAILRLFLLTPTRFSSIPLPYSYIVKLRLTSI